MLDKSEMSLDEIIKQHGIGKFKRGGRGRNNRGRATGRTSSGRIDRPMRNRRGQFNSTRTSFPRRTSGDINSQWKHDMYDGPKYRRGGMSVHTSGGPSKIQVSNLDYAVSNSDIQELFTEFGPLKSTVVNYDKSGRSLGTANVVFERRADALQAVKTYNGVPLDGRPMNIELITNISALQQPRLGMTRRPIRGSNRGFGRGGFRRGGGRNTKTVTPTAEELDADLDAYISSANNQ